MAHFVVELIDDDQPMASSHVFAHRAGRVTSVGGMGLATSARVLDFDYTTVNTLGFDFDAVTTRLLSGAGLATSALVASFSRFAMLAPLDLHTNVAVRPVLAAGAGDVAVPSLPLQ